jgi:RNA polymerase sigma-70 factor (ECF subfamily)
MAGSLAALDLRLSDESRERAAVAATGAAGDAEWIVEAHYLRILRAALLLTGSRGDAEDLAQETFLEAFASLDAFEGRSRIDTWLYAILLNQHRRQLRGKHRAWKRMLEWFGRRAGHGDTSPAEQKAELAEWRESVWSAVAALPVAQAHAVTLRYAEGLSYQEIAQVLQCPVGTVRSRLHHGLAALRSTLGDRFGP